MTDEQIKRQIEVIRQSAVEVLAAGPEACRKFLIDAGIIKNNYWEEFPDYVKSNKPIKDCIRGEVLYHENGKVFKVKSHGRTMTLHGTLRWQKYSYKDFVPSTETEYNEYLKQSKK